MVTSNDVPEPPELPVKHYPMNNPALNVVLSRLRRVRNEMSRDNARPPSGVRAGHRAPRRTLVG